ncbi:hypothetical protein RHMOL_Rhmol09G0052400 [Rhododendron molle]|uniref:Uncharacterized protein n=1 Tax=Rhododendron molle TaxID=49168 RepID=A0ACC0MBX4_RHOML|nr:hypothetical protein RHMOL_Rhmol09G0052400 [Rhododendron molle]
MAIDEGAEPEFVLIVGQKPRTVYDMFLLVPSPAKKGRGKGNKKGRGKGNKKPGKGDIPAVPGPGGLGKGRGAKVLSS